MSEIKTLNYIDDLEGLSAENFKEFILQVLTGDSNDVFKLEGGIYDFVFAERYCKTARLAQTLKILGEEDQKSQERMKQATGKILEEWIERKSNYKDDWWGFLLALIGDFKPENVYGNLRNLAESGYLKGRRGDREELHHRLLSVWSMWGIRDEKSLRIYQRDLNDYRYAAQAYRKLWEFYPSTGVKNIGVLLEKYIEMNRNNEKWFRLPHVIGKYLKENISKEDGDFIFPYSLELINLYLCLNDAGKSLLDSALEDNGFRVTFNLSETSASIKLEKVKEV